VTVRDLEAESEFTDRYDALVLAPGAAPVKPPLPGVDLEGVFTVRTIPDVRRIREWIAARQAKRAVVIGGGFIGLETAENLRHRGLEVSVLEMAAQVMPPLDPEVVKPLEAHLAKHGIALILGDAFASIERRQGSGLVVHSKNGKALDADLVILAIGVRPETGLARAAGLEIGERGGIRVDDRMRTSDPAIFAVGDAVEVEDVLTGGAMLLALAGPANRQGRIAADVICGRDSRFRGVQATAICEVFGMSVASTGLTEKAARRAGRNFSKVYLHPKNHVGYYPGAETIHLKLLFDPESGAILGGQASGMADVARKIDVLSAFIQKGGTVHDLEEGEFCYAPQSGAAKDALNFAGMIAVNDLEGLSPLAQWDSIGDDAVLIDVREPAEFAAGHARDAISIPLHTLRSRMDEIPDDHPVLVYCGVGQRGHYAARIVRQHGLDARNLSGGWTTGALLDGRTALEAVGAPG
jgi:NADPH-dependent 2,4-dienoyl-CoA reductase/sulfur reductase-like enzyme/rhodanese-related sulfurtransferase